jgi:hypothetical protein
VTAEPYAAATGLIERFAGAYSSAVPAGPRDDGFFGPASVTWRVSADLSAPGTGRRPVHRRDDGRGRAARCPARHDPAGCRCPAPVHDGRPAAAARHARSAEVMAWLLGPPGMEEEIAELWQHIRDAAVTALPGWARDMCRCPAPARLTPERRTQIRQALGVLDTAILGQPGVLQARQRLTLRVRSAGRR